MSVSLLLPVFNPASSGYDPRTRGGKSIDNRSTHQVSFGSMCYVFHVSGPGPPDITFYTCLFTFALRLPDVMNNEACDASEGSSLCGDLVDIGLHEGLTDVELNDELAELSDTDDGINVTIKEVAKPKVASVVVEHLNVGVPAKSKSKNRSGSAKRGARKAGQAQGKASSGSLISMLSRVSVTEGVSNGKVILSSQSEESNNSKRLRSPASNLANKDQPPKVRKFSNAEGTSTVSAAQSVEPAYREVALQSLKVKICLADRQPVGKELMFIRDFLAETIEQAVMQGKFVPLFRNDTYIGKDGVYLFLRRLSRRGLVGEYH